MTVMNIKMEHKVTKEGHKWIIKGQNITLKKMNLKESMNQETKESCQETEEESTQTKTKKCKNNDYKASLCVIIKWICALLNSGGGRLELILNESPTRQQISECMRNIEQKVLLFLNDVRAYTKLFRWDLSSRDYIVLNIDQPDRFFTVNYNFCLPTNTQVLNLPPNLSSEFGIKETLQSSKGSSQPAIEIESHEKDFIQYREIGPYESDTVQFKDVKSVSTPNVSLAKRITGKANKFSSYVSAFANHRGGNIYYGIDDEGTIIGEKVKNKDDICKAVVKIIGQDMIWTESETKPERGKHWEVYFQPVKKAGNENQGEQENEIQELFIVVIYVARFPGGVFTEEPESYCIDSVDGYADPQIKKMKFSEWKERFLPPSRKEGEQDTQERSK